MAFSKFLREHSQMIAAGSLGVYILAVFAVPANTPNTFKNIFYQLKNRNGRDVDIPEDDEAQISSVLYRFKLDKSKFFKANKFFYTNNLDYCSLGMLSGINGCETGVPITHSAKDRNHLRQLLKNGVYVQSDFLSWNKIDSKLGSQSNEFCDQLLLSDDAKSFAVARELFAAQGLHSVYKVAVDALLFSLGYSYIYIKNRSTQVSQFIYKHRLRQAIFIPVGLLISYAFSQWNKQLKEKYKDQKSMELGLDMCEGAIEYYDKLLKRNMYLRECLDNGEKIYDANGNQNYKTIRIPLIDYCVFIKNYGGELTDRREFCKLKFQEMIEKYKNESIKSKNTDEQQKEAVKEDKELAIFKKIRETMQKKNA